MSLRARVVVAVVVAQVAVASPAAPRPGVVRARASPRPVGFAATGATYVRADTDRTTVVSPRVHFRATLDEERHALDAAYTADVWTSASIDIRTAATAAVTEQRDEVTVGYTYARDTWRVGAAYRMSHEGDYLANGATIHGRVEAFERNTTIDLRATTNIDRVGRSGARGALATNVAGGAYLSWTQVLARATLLQLSAEFRGLRGYLASPYRFVAIGGDGTCAGAAGLCVPEQHPGARARYAVAARVRQGLARRWSLGGAYRYYVDDWGVQAHTALLELSVAPRPSWTLGVEYRPYRQGAAYFYRPRYGDSGAPGFVTRDRELSPLWQHRITALFDGHHGTRAGPVLHVGGLVGAARLGYDDFVGLTKVWAFEIGVVIGADFGAP